MVVPGGLTKQVHLFFFFSEFERSFFFFSEFEHLCFLFVFLFMFPDCVFGAAQAARVVAEGPQLKFPLTLTRVQTFYAFYFVSMHHCTSVC